MNICSKPLKSLTFRPRFQIFIKNFRRFHQSLSYLKISFFYYFIIICVPGQQPLPVIQQQATVYPPTVTAHAHPHYLQHHQHLQQQAQAHAVQIGQPLSPWGYAKPQTTAQVTSPTADSWMAASAVTPSTTTSSHYAASPYQYTPVSLASPAQLGTELSAATAHHLHSPSSAFVPVTVPSQQIYQPLYHVADANGSLLTAVPPLTYQHAYTAAPAQHPQQVHRALSLASQSSFGRLPH